MAHILCMTTGLSGILHASLEAALRLRRDGHTVTYACPVDVRDAVHAAGLRFETVAPVDLEPAPQIDGSELPRWRRKWRELRTAKRRRQLGVEALQMQPFRALLNELDPDLLLLDAELDAHIITAFAEGWPLALLNQFFAVDRRPGVPPLTHATLPGTGFRGSRLGIELAWLRHRLAKWWGLKKTALRYVGTDRRAVLRQLAKDVGFPQRTMRSLDWDAVFTYRGIPTLNLTACEMDFPHSVPHHERHVGPMVLEARAEDVEVLRVCDEAKRDGGSLIYASLTSMAGGDRALLPRLVAAVAEHPRWTLVFGLGGSDPEALGELPPNVHAVRWAPQLDVLRRADCAVVHGGIHTLHECIATSTAIVVYSGGRFDQNGNGARVAFHGIGVVGDPDDEPKAIARCIEHAMADREIQERREEMRRCFETYVAERRLEVEVRRLVDHSRESNQRQQP